MNSGLSTMGYFSLISVSIVEVHCEAILPCLVQFILWCRFGIHSKQNRSSSSELFSVWSLSSYFLFQSVAPSLIHGYSICKGINGECNFFKIIFCGNFFYYNNWWFESHIFGISLLFGVLIVMWFGFAVVTQLGVGFVILWSNLWLVSHYIKHGSWNVFLLHIKYLFKCFLGHNLPNPCPTF